MNNLFCLTYDIDETSGCDLEDVVSSVKVALPGDSQFIVMPHIFQLSKLDTKTLSDLKDHLETILYSRYHMEQTQV